MIKYIILILIPPSLLFCPLAQARRGQPHPKHRSQIFREEPNTKNRSQLLSELKKCENPGQPDTCDVLTVYRVANLYERGDTSVLQKLMAVAPNSRGVLSVALGDVFTDLLCRKPRSFLRAVAKRPRSEQDKLLFLAVAGDGSGMGCEELDSLRKRLRVMARSRNDGLSGLAARCLVQVDKYNPTN